MGVHHIDGNHDNNVLANLECITTKQHGERHRALGPRHHSNQERLEALKEGIRERLAAQVRYWMSKFDMDVNAIAEASGLARRSIYRIINAKTGASVDAIAQLADGFRIPPAVLLTPLPVDNGSDE